MANPYIYVFVRQDMPKEYQIVQACHACLELEKAPQKTHLVLIGVKDQLELLKVSQNLEMKDIKFEMFFEPDYETGYSALATEPIYGSKRLTFKKYKLLKF